MGYGHGIVSANSGTKATPIRMKRYSREFSSLYTNATSTSGDCAISSSSRRLRDAAGTLTYRKGSPKVTFLSDDGRTSFSFSLREVTAEIVRSRVHFITIP